jgi:NRPS condensation-like uncharacterized protein
MTNGGGRYFELSLTDRAMGVLHDEWRFTPQLGIEFDTLLDHTQLGRAVALLARRHPILTSTVDALDWPARWQPERTTPELVETFDTPGDQFASPAGVAALWSSELDAANGPTCRLVHLHDDARSRLVLNLHHAVADGHGMVIILDDLRVIYAALQRGEQPTVDVDWSPRTISALRDAKGVSLDERWRESSELAQRWGGVPRSTHRDASVADRVVATDPALADGTMHFDDALVNAVDAGARRHGWRLNHVVLALLARAWSRVLGREPDEPSVSGWLVAVDCRRQFGLARGMGNLSGFEPVSMIDVESEDLLAVIESTRTAFEPLTRIGAGLAAEVMSPVARVTPPLVLDRAIRDSFELRTRTLRYSRLYTHTDRVSASMAHWGSTSATGMRWITPRCIAPPYAAIGLMRFGGVTSVTPEASLETLPPDSAAALGVELQAGFEELDARL